MNFNTGNFFLQTRDYSLPGLGTSVLDIVRTYNTQSSEKDGPFGAKWATAYSQHLRLFNEGSVAYRRADGSEIISRTEALGQTMRYEYDASGRQLRETNALGCVTAYIYDANESMVKVLTKVA